MTDPARTLPPHELKARRGTIGATQAEMSRLLGVNSRTYQRWEAAEQDIPAIVDPATRALIAEHRGASGR